MDWIVGEAHQSKLEALAAGAVKVEVSVAFLTDTGAHFILGLARGRDVELTVSLYMGVTRSSALKLLHKHLTTDAGAMLKVRVAQAMVAGFHGKVYGFQYADRSSAWVVGSANATHTGLNGGGDVSVIVRDPPVGFALPVESNNPLKLSAWATAAQPGPLAEIIETYRESVTRGGKFEEDAGSVWFLTGLRDASTAERKAVDELAAGIGQGAAGENSGEQEHPTGRWLIIADTQGDRRLHNVLGQVRRGDVVVQRYKKGTLQDQVMAATVQGLHETTLRGRHAFVAFFEADLILHPEPGQVMLRANGALDAGQVEGLAGAWPDLRALLLNGGG